MYHIGIDAGGTKTTAAAYDNEGNLLYQATTGFGNVTVDFEKGMENIKQAIDEIIAKQGNEISKIVLGCAGIETGDKKAKAREALEQKYGNIIEVTNDAVLALYAALKGQDGILIIAGTGSIGYLKRGNDVYRFGGWGHLINDDGSGYSIVMKAIRYIAYSFDTNNSDTALKRAIFAKLNISELRELIQFTYASSKGEIASLVPVIEQVANEGDMQAQSIFSWAGERLAYLVIGLCRTYNVIKPQIALNGSVIRKTEYVRSAFCDVLNCELDGYTIVNGDFDATKGGYYLIKAEE